MSYKFSIYDYLLFIISYVFFFLFIAQIQGIFLGVAILSGIPSWIYLAVAIFLNIWAIPIPVIHPRAGSPLGVSKEGRPLKIFPPPVAKEKKESPAARFQQRLAKTHKGFIDKISAVFSRGSVIDEKMLSELEETLLGTDIGIKTAYMLFEQVRERIKTGGMDDPGAAMDIIEAEILDILKRKESLLIVPDDIRPFVIMVAGVNGSGKTTTIAKIARRFIADGMSVIVAAGDTFRAAAIEQLEHWATKIGADFVGANAGADPSAVAFDALEAAISREKDVLIIDTAGRLHTKADLMEELKKTKGVLDKRLAGAPHEILLILDATIGQNAIEQTRQFHKDQGITGIVLTKLDGSSKGGVIVGIANEFDIPIRFVGIGEDMDDLQPFSAQTFVDALFLDK
ncbi:MAG: signal recognition particle-docking protein FtsY [Thermodesulfobacteriota bacterium]|nr:signal recognition particle-docking protein FtsY [Thermodesulfobacteriota bacterium]